MKNQTITIPPVARQWIAALRSGKYLQTTSPYADLRDNTGYTAIGVLCTLAVAAKVISTYPSGPCMPAKVQEWAGMSQFPAGVNFDAGTFAEIANHLETDWRGIFAHVGSPPKSGKLVSLTAAQRTALRGLWDKGHTGKTYRSFRRSVLGVSLPGESIIVAVNGKWKEINAKGEITK